MTMHFNLHNDSAAWIRRDGGDGGAGGGAGSGTGSGNAGAAPGGVLAQLPARFLFPGQPLRMGPERSFAERCKAEKDAPAGILARSRDGLWVYALCQHGDGWVPRTSMQIEGEWTTLPVWTEPIRGYAANQQGKMARQTDLKNGFAQNYQTLASLPSGMGVRLLAQSPDTFWLFVWADNGKNGWVPRSNIETAANWKELPAWANVFIGAQTT